MVLIAALAAAALLTARRTVVAVLSLVALTVAVLAALCTYSRAAWLGLVVAVGVFGALRLGAGIQRLLRPSAGTDTSTMNRRLVGAGVLVVVLAGAVCCSWRAGRLSRGRW